MNLSRRSFLNSSFKAVAGAGVLGRLALAAGGSNYKALVCVFLNGGNDGHNMLIPMTTANNRYETYAAARGELALPQGDLWPVAAGAGNTYGLHPKLKEIQALYNTGKAAFVANVGNIVVPTTRTQYLNQAVKLPEALFSHSSQQNQWQTATSTDLVHSGWGGRAADVLAASPFPVVLNTGGGSLFSVGVTSHSATVQAGPVGLLDGSLAAFQQLLNFDNGLQLVQASNTITKRGINDGALLKAALAGAPALKTVFPDSGLGRQMRQVAQIIAVRGALGMNRQIFFVSRGGFDTHGNQLADQAALLGELSLAMNAMYAATVELGVDDSVTTFTNSEFGRTLQPSSGGGSDHAWGSHALAVGGAVRGGAIYGTFPTLALGGPDDANTRGVLIPTTSVAQYSATLAQWFGIPAGNLVDVFPTVANFGSSDLGFLG